MLPERIKNIKVSSLIQNGYKNYSEDKDNYMEYVKRIPLWKYNNIPVLTGVIIITMPSKRIRYDVITQTGQLYAPFYNPFAHGSHSSLRDELNKKFIAEIKHLETKPTRRRTVRKSM